MPVIKAFTIPVQLMLELVTTLVRVVYSYFRKG